MTMMTFHTGQIVVIVLEILDCILIDEYFLESMVDFVVSVDE